MVWGLIYTTGCVIRSIMSYLKGALEVGGGDHHMNRVCVLLL